MRTYRDRPVAPADYQEPKAEPDPVEGAYRCTECGHGKKLYAYAGANAWGPLAANGRELDEHWAVDEWGIHEDSIQCNDHPGAALESFVGGHWRRWWFCPKCSGGGRIEYRGQYGQEYTMECDGETPFPRRPIRASGQTTVHQGWLSPEEHAAATAKAAA